MNFMVPNKSICPSKAKEFMFCNHRIYADEVYEIGILTFYLQKILKVI